MGGRRNWLVSREVVGLKRIVGLSASGADVLNDGCETDELEKFRRGSAAEIQCSLTVYQSRARVALAIVPQSYSATNG